MLKLLSGLLVAVRQKLGWKLLSGMLAVMCRRPESQHRWVVYKSAPPGADQRRARVRLADDRFAQANTSLCSEVPVTTNDPRSMESEFERRKRRAFERNCDPFAPGRLLERRTDFRLSHNFAIGDRVQHPLHGEGWVLGIPTPILDWPERVVVRWDKFGLSFDGNCNDNKWDRVPPKSISMVKEFVVQVA